MVILQCLITLKLIYDKNAEDILTNEKVFREGSAVRIEGRTQLPQREDCRFS
jgi:hypothetical protein